MSAVGTVGVSVWLLTFQVRDRVKRRERQARAVAAWEEELDYMAEPPTIAVRVFNGSELPIFKVSVQVDVGVRGTFVRETASISPRETREWLLELPGYPHSDENPPSVMFTDARGVRWVREYDGTLRRKSEDEGEFAPDPAAYDSIEAHPTLTPDYRDREARFGRKIRD